MAWVPKSAVCKAPSCKPSDMERAIPNLTLLTMNVCMSSTYSAVSSDAQDCWCAGDGGGGGGAGGGRSRGGRQQRQRRWAQRQCGPGQPAGQRARHGAPQRVAVRLGPVIRLDSAHNMAHRSALPSVPRAASPPGATLQTLNANMLPIMRLGKQSVVARPLAVPIILNTRLELD